MVSFTLLSEKSKATQLQTLADGELRTVGADKIRKSLKLHLSLEMVFTGSFKPS